MKIVRSKIYTNLVFSQTMVDWDNQDAGPANIDEVFYDVNKKPAEPKNLPVIREEDLHNILEDNLEIGNDVAPEGAPAVEKPEDVLPEERPVFTNAYDAFEWAEKQNAVVKMNYTTRGGINITREVEPHGRFYARTTHRTILVVYDRTVGSVRAYIMRNINGMDFTGEKFQKKFIVQQSR